ncbi:MAG: hypothetical protein IIZ34_04580, partial [Eubacterium sp.]|nr:hypothetical protein [Eubacterium sp.]
MVRMMKEKANPKSAAPRKVKGTVLFTVVCVMMVLIVFMMGTLALAATANKRAYQNYQKTQTAAYARAVLDSAIEAIQNDTGTTGGFKDQIANNTSLTMQVSTGADGLASDVTITRTGEVRRVYDEDSDSWVDGNVYRLSTTMTSESTGVETEYVAFLIDGYNTTGTPRRVNNNNNPRAFVSGGYSNGAATAGYFIGGSSINIGSTPVQITMGNQARYMAPFYANATDLTFNAQTSVVFNKVAPSNFFAVSGDFHPGNDFTVNWDNMSDVWTGSAWDHSHGTAWPTGVVGYEEIPCIYVGGTFYKSTNDLKLSLGNNGTAAQLPLNLYCGSFESAGTSKFEMTGDMYCFDENKTSHLTTQNNGTALYKWSAANINEMGTAKNTQFGSV